MRRSILACGLVLALASITAAAAAARSEVSAPPRPSTTLIAKIRRPQHSHAYAIWFWSRHVRSYRAQARHWLTVIHTQPPQGATRSLAGRSPRELRSMSRMWHRIARADAARAHHPPYLRTWMCIHHYEGSWHDSGSPYWGGLQMDYSFQRSYGGWLLRTKGTANHWTSLEQIWVAVRAWHTRGFAPWPNTGAACGV